MNKNTSETNNSVALNIDEQVLYQKWTANLVEVERTLVRHERGLEDLNLEDLSAAYHNFVTYTQLLELLVKRAQNRAPQAAPNGEITKEIEEDVDVPHVA